MKYKLTPIQLSHNKQVDDAAALLGLLNEHCKADTKMVFSRARAGRANVELGKFTIPQHALNNGETYLSYYVIHEFTHCLGLRGHNKDFKQRERALLRLFNITIDYASAYPRTLYANGEKAYQKKSMPSIKSLETTYHK